MSSAKEMREMVGMADLDLVRDPKLKKMRKAFGDANPDYVYLMKGWN